jgi:hypothetical protein
VAAALSLSDMVPRKFWASHNMHRQRGWRNNTPRDSQEDRALLFIHGIGNARPGDYDPLVAQVRQILNEQSPQTAIYFFYYDQFNQWFADKTQAAQGCTKLVQVISSRLNQTTLGTTIADFVSDVIWPILIADARSAIASARIGHIWRSQNNNHSSTVKNHSTSRRKHS